ncbi:MAG: glycine cleavage system aminomethyltransferase GcvT [Lachnospiraceae bacterium]|nr:glycine cleavage system aminomethyltransferase GcvT [Lachnospiraceae bacterium]
MELKTPLYDCHVEAGGKIVPFAGYLLPVQYGTGVIKEHMAVRTQAGLFDVSHMGEVTLKGKDSLANLNYILTNDYTSLKTGSARYSPMCNEQGGVVDDLIVYKKGDDDYLIVVNAANRHKDFDFIKAHLFGDVECEDISDSIAQIALQGPESQKILSKLVSEDDIPAKYYTFKENVEIGGNAWLISQTGYTGEFGFELYGPAEEAPKVWNMLLEAGKEFGLIPCGLGARDTLRLEAAMPLYGHEMNDEITPLETGLNFAVKMKKDNFIGKDAMVAKGDLTRKRVGLKVTGRGIVREEQKVFSGDKEIGFTTSGTHCPYLGYAIGMAILDIDYTEVGTPVEVEVRGRRVACEIVPLPFYKREK